MHNLVHKLCMDISDSNESRAFIQSVARCIHAFVCSAQLSSLEIESISKEISCAEEHEDMNMSSSLIGLYILYPLYTIWEK